MIEDARYQTRAELSVVDQYNFILRQQYDVNYCPFIAHTLDILAQLIIVLVETGHKNLGRFLSLKKQMP